MFKGVKIQARIAFRLRVRDRGHKGQGLGVGELLRPDQSRRLCVCVYVHIGENETTSSQSSRRSNVV